jgi:iron complex outermembrane receptor protein
MRATLTAGSAIGLTLAFAGTAFAQTAPASDARDDGQLSTIVVTAEHREANPQTTPIALSVIGGDDLRNRGIKDISDLSVQAPGISFSTLQGKPMLTIRGVSSRDTTEMGDPAVTVNTDGFYLNRPYALTATMYDLDRVEILRGPQGTLNGRNSIGGAINVITKKPSDKFEGYASVQYGNYDALQTQGAINIPVADWLQVRASFFQDSHDGYRHNGIVRGDDADSKSGRLSIVFQPTYNLSGLVTLTYAHMSGAGNAAQNVAFNYNEDGSLNYGRPDGINGKDWQVYTRPYLRSTEKQVRGQLEYDAGIVKITALGGYDYTNWHHGNDQSSPDDLANAYSFDENQYPKTVNAELRIASNGSGPLQWQVGGFYFHEKSRIASGNKRPLTVGFDEYFGFRYNTKTSSKAVYGQASYELTSALKITGGIRYTKDSKAEDGYYGNISAGVIYANEEGGAKFSKVTYHAALDYALTDQNFLYAKFDTGYKAGGFNMGATNYAPEKIKTWEIGSKNRFLDNRLELNLAAYYSDYTDQQVSTYSFVEGEAVQLTQNAGSSHIYGIESDVTYRSSLLGTLGLTANWMHARYTDFLSIPEPNNPLADTSSNVQLSGNTPPQSPTWTLGASWDRDWDNVMGGTLTTQVQTKYQSATNFSFYNFAATRQGGYTTTNASLTYRPDDGAWSATAFVRNLENHTILAAAEVNGYATAYTYEFMPPRTYGVRLQYNW